MAEFKIEPEKDDQSGVQKIFDGEYDVPKARFGPHPIILDIGANIGAFSAWASQKWPDATIFAYEPHPEVFALLKTNVQDLPGVVIRRRAVSNFDGKAMLYAGMHNRGESSLVNVGEQSTALGGKVKVVDARSLPEADFLKVDTEGSERAIIEAYPHKAALQGLALEWHSYEDRAFFKSYLRQYGLLLDSDVEWSSAPPRGVQKFYRPHYPKLFIGILSGGGKSWDGFNASLDSLKELAPKSGVELAICKESGTGVDRARNKLYATARDVPGVTHFMFLDDDIVFEPEWVIGMVKSGLDVVGGAYPRKQIDWKRVHAAVGRGVPADELPLHSTDWIINTASEDGTHIRGIGDFMPVEEIGTGFLMFKMGVSEDLIKRWGRDMAYVADYPPVGSIHHMLFACQRDPNCPREAALLELKLAAQRHERTLSVGTHEDNDAGWSLALLQVAAVKYAEACSDAGTVGRYLTEDYAFCRLARMAGYRIYVFLNASIKHLGTHCYEGAISKYFLPESQASSDVT